MASIREHNSHVLKYGLARTNRFQILIPLPAALQSETSTTDQEKTDSVFGEEVIKVIRSYAGSGSAEITRGLDIMCEQTELPGKSLTTTEIKYNGDYHKMPYSVVYGVQPFTFHTSSDMAEKNIMDEWMNLIYDPVKHEVSYLEDYAVNITINQLNNNDEVMYSVVLKDAFPIMANPLTLSNAEDNQAHKLMVQFAYKRWVRAGEKESEGTGLVDALSQTPLGPYTTPILSNPAIQEGLEYLKDQGIDLEGEAVAIYNQVDDIVRNTTGTSINKAVSLIEGIKSATESNNEITDEQKARVIEIITETLSRLRNN